MDISKIKNTKFIKKMSISEMKSLCSDLRDYIIKYVSKNGGYLSSNLSNVEISVALNKCFSEKDKILFNGEDCNYTNRILNGLDISNNECINSLSYGIGLCSSRDINHKDYNVVSVINSDNALSGTNIDTLNYIGLEKRKMIIVFNDDTSIDKGIGIVDKFISNLRNTKTYINLKEDVKELIRPKKGGEKIIEGIHNIKSNIKKSVIDEGVFGEYNIDYIGPVDGHNLDELIRAFEIAKNKEYPCVVHCITTKGKGYIYAESSTDESFVKTTPFDIKTGRKYIEESSGYINCKNLVSDNLLKLMSENKDMIAICPDNKNDASLNQVFAKYPDRSFDTGKGIEKGLGFACGLSLDGKIPFISIKSSDLAEGYQMLIKQVDKLKSSLIIGLLCDDYDDIQVLEDLKNTIIVTAKDSQELSNLLYTATKLDSPFIIRYANSLIKMQETKHFSKLEVGKWQNFANNVIGSTCIIANGLDIDMINKNIVDNKLPYTLINANYINPIDNELLKKVLTKAKHVFVYNNAVEDAILREANMNKYKCNITIIKRTDIKSLFKLIEKEIDA